MGKKRSIAYSGVVLAAMMLAACAPAANVETATPGSDLVPTATAEVATPEPSSALAACPAESADFKLSRNDMQGYCLLYPAADTLVPPRSIVIGPENATADTLGDAWVDIAVDPAGGLTAAQVADAEIAAAGEGFNISREELVIDGEQAVQVDGLPGPDPWRKVFVVSNGWLYTLTFMPWGPSGDPDQPTLLEQLYESVVDSMRFLP